MTEPTQYDPSYFDGFCPDDYPYLNAFLLEHNMTEQQLYQFAGLIVRSRRAKEEYLKLSLIGKLKRWLLALWRAPSLIWSIGFQGYWNRVHFANGF